MRGPAALAAVGVLAAASIAAPGCVGDELLAPASASATSAGSGAGSGAGTGDAASTGAGGGGGGPGGDPAVHVVWARRWGGKATDERVAAIVAEPDDAIVVAGSIGAFDGVEPTLRAVDEEDVLLARFDAAGTVTHAVAVGGPGNDAPRALARRADGSLVVLGVFTTLLDELDPPLVAYGGAAAFVAAFDPSFAPLWGKALLGANAGRGQLAMALGGDGAVYAGGTFDGALAIDDLVLIAGGATDGFLARFGPEGSLDWVLALDGAGAEHLEVGALAAIDGDIVLTAQLRGTLAASGVAIAASAAARRPVVVRISAEGEVASASVLEGEGAASIGRITARPGGMVASIALGGSLFTEDGVVAAAGEGDATLVWTDPAGAPLFARTWGDRRAQGIAALAQGADLAAVGSFQGAIDFGQGANKAPGGRSDGFVVELSDSGEVQRSFAIGDGPVEEGRRTGSQGASAVAWLGGGDLALAGSFTGTLLLGDVLLKARGDVDSWIARVAAR